MKTAYNPSTTPLNALSAVGRFQKHRDALRRGEEALARLRARWGWRFSPLRLELRARAASLLGSAHFIATHALDRATRRSALGFAQRLRQTVGLPIT